MKTAFFDYVGDACYTVITKGFSVFSNYTDASAEAYGAALNTAKGVLNKDDALQSEVDAALAALDEAGTDFLNRDLGR